RTPRPPCPPPLPYTTLFRSAARGERRVRPLLKEDAHVPLAFPSARGAAASGGAGGRFGRRGPGGRDQPHHRQRREPAGRQDLGADRKSTRLNSSHQIISYAV